MPKEKITEETSAADVLNAFELSTKRSDCPNEIGYMAFRRGRLQNIFSTVINTVVSRKSDQRHNDNARRSRGRKYLDTSMCLADLYTIRVGWDATLI